MAKAFIDQSKLPQDFWDNYNATGNTSSTSSGGSYGLDQSFWDNYNTVSPNSPYSSAAVAISNQPNIGTTALPSPYSFMKAPQVPFNFADQKPSTPIFSNSQSYLQNDTGGYTQRKDMALGAYTGILQAPIPWYKNPTNPLGAAVNSVSEAFNNVVDSYGALFAMEPVQNSGTDKTTGKQIPYNPVGMTSTQNTPAKRIGSSISAAASTLGLIPEWLAFSAGLAAAQQSNIALIADTVKVAQAGFQALGQGGAVVASKALDMTPLDNQTKDVFRQPIEEIGALIAQIGVAHVSHVVLKTGISEYTKKVQKGVIDAQKSSVTVTPEVAQTIVNKAVKEVPMEVSANMIVPTPEGDVKVYTNQKIVLQNFIKGREDLNYQTVKTLGNDINGNPIQSRFEWDYKKQEGTILTTKKTTTENLAHELGHYYDRKLSSDITTQLSDIVPDYTKNKDAADGALTAYAIHQLGDSASAKEITAQVKSLVDNFRSDLSKLSTQQTFNEQFADGVARVIRKPEEAQKIAPDFTDFVKYNLTETGIIANAIQRKALESGISPIQMKALHTDKAFTEANPQLAELKQQNVETQAKDTSNPRNFTSAEEFLKAQGEPLLHGTTQEFNNFDISKAGTRNINDQGFAGKGIYLSNSQEVAETFSTGKDIYGGKKGNARIIEVYIDHKSKILVVNDFGELADKLGLQRSENRPAKMGLNEFTRNQAPLISQKARELGYDAIKVDGGGIDKYGKQTYEMAVINPDIIKTKSQLTDIYNKAHETPTPNTTTTTDALGNTVEKNKKTQFASTGLDTGKRVEGRLSYNPDKINAPEDIEALFKTVGETNKEFSDQRISKSNEDIKALAREVGLTPEELIRVQPGSVANAETLMKARTVLADVAQDLRNYLKTVDTATATPEQMKVFKEKFMRLQGVAKAVSGLRTESSNAFRSNSIEATPGENAILEEMMVELKRQDATSADSLEGFMKKSRELVEPTTSDKLWHLWYMSMLSGEGTQYKNFIGNIFSIASEGAATAVRNPKEFPSAIAGLFKGLAGSKEKVLGALKHGDTTKFEQQGKKQVVFKGLARPLNIASYIGHAMAATDTFFYEGLKGMEQTGLARMQAVNEGFKGEQLQKRIKVIINENHPDFAEQVNQFARYGTYNQDPQGALGVVSKGLSSIARGVPGGKFVIPFTRVVANVINNGLDWTPLGFKRALVRPVEIGGKTFGKEGGLFADFSKEPLTDRQRHQELARAALGTAGMVYLASYASQGNLSGAGPSDSHKRQQLEAAGWRKNSIKIGDKWYPYQNWGPLGMPMTIVGNWYDATAYSDMSEKDIGQRLGISMLGTVKSVLDMSFLSGVSNLIDGIQNYDKGGAAQIMSFVAGIATAPIPNFIKQTHRLFDPTYYQSSTLWEKMLSSATLTGGMKPQLNVFGQTIEGDRITGILPGKRSDDKLINYLADNQVWIPYPSKSTKIYDYNTGENRALTDDEYYQYVKKSGTLLHESLSNDLDFIKQLPEDQRTSYINSQINSIHESVKQSISLQI